MRMSVVVVTYRRLESLPVILGAWLRETPDVWLADCSGQFKTALPIVQATFNRDPGSRSRHALAMMTEGDYVVKADDDFLPLPGFLADWRAAYKAVGENAILGVIGRRFNGPTYYGQTEFFRSSLVKEPTWVDFAGVCTISPRWFLAFDLSGCESPIEDLFWQMKAFPKARKFVFPTGNYKNLPSAKERECLFHDPKAREIREAFYRRYYELNYQEARSGS